MVFPSQCADIAGVTLFLVTFCPTECRVLRLNVTECTALVQTSSRDGPMACRQWECKQPYSILQSHNLSKWRSSVLCQGSRLPLVIAFLMFAFGISLVFARLLNTEGYQKQHAFEARFNFVILIMCMTGLLTDNAFISWSACFCFRRRIDHFGH